MAEFLGQKKEPSMDPFNQMGHPIPFGAREEGYKHAQAMGLDKARAYEVVSAVSEALARDEPYIAMQQAMKHLDLTGTYRLMAVLLASAAEYRRKEGEDVSADTSHYARHGANGALARTAAASRPRRAKG
jgi:hypothetical protein